MHFPEACSNIATFTSTGQKGAAINMQATVQDWSHGDVGIKWGAILAGLAIGIAVQIVFTLLGLAIGGWSIDLHDVQPAEGIPLGTGLWTGFSILISAFIGGYVTSRLSGSCLRMDGLYHGAVLWGVTWLVFAWLATSTLLFMVGGLFSAFGGGLQMLNQGVGPAVSAAILTATEKPELQAAAITKDADNITGQAKSGGSVEKVSDSAVGEIREKLAAMDRDAAVNVMVNKLGLSEKQAQEVAQSTIGVIASIKEAGKGVNEQSMELGNTAIARLGATAWWLFLFAVLSLGMSLVGGAFGIAEGLLCEKDETRASDVKRVVHA
jgi:hypothetical protein